MEVITSYNEIEQSNIMNKVDNMKMMFIKIENDNQFLSFKENINNVCSNENEKDRIIRILEKEYELKGSNEILYIFIGETYTQKFYYKVAGKKTKTVLKKASTPDGLSSSPTALYFITLNNKYKDYNISFFETKNSHM